MKILFLLLFIVLLAGCSGIQTTVTSSQLCERDIVLPQQKGFIYALGKGDSEATALVDAQQQLSQMINTKLTSYCDDKESTEQTENGLETVNKQTCSLQSRSSTRLTYTPVIERDQCGDEVRVVIALDERLLIEKLSDVFSAQSKSKHGLESVNSKIPFSNLHYALQERRLALAFDEEKRLWQVTTARNSLFIPQQELWEGIDWQGCLGATLFSLASWGEEKRETKHNEPLEFQLKPSEHHQYASVFEVNEVGGVEVLQKNISLKDSNNLSALSLKAKLIEAQLHSDYVYFVVLSLDKIDHYPNRYLLNPGKAFSDFLDDTLSYKTADICAWPLSVYK
ncbi:MAG: hypothetical protein ACJAS1_004413 [Oleiphilaceae bacterium]|jgi:hypothetical protein